jgi:phosphatidylglycerophosphate synthase
MTSVKSPRRVVNTFLQPLERRIVDWLVARLPLWVSPDLLTGAGLLGAAVVFWGYALTNLNKNFLWLASLGFVLHWFGDSLDGTLARYRNIQKPRYGFYVDHVVDALGELLIALGLGLSPYVRFDVALLILVGYLLMTMQNYLFTCATNVFIMSQGKIGGTEIRLLAILINTVMFFAGFPVIQLPIGAVSVYDLFGITFAGMLLIAFVVSTVVRSARLAKMDNRRLFENDF